MKDRKVITGKNVPRADIYTFETSPYELLSFAHVYREDGLLSDGGIRYQRAIKSDKLKEIRQKLLTDNDINFIFPSNILLILSPNCRYDWENQELIIPKKYGNVSVIDGQHRLFAYADREVSKKLAKSTDHADEYDGSQILVSAIMFEQKDWETINQCATRIFIEINSNQTSIDQRLLDWDSWMAGYREPENVAEAIIRSFNERRNKPFSLGDTNKTNADINYQPIKKELQNLFNSIQNIRKAKAKRKSKKRRRDKYVYEQIFNIQLSEFLDFEQPQVDGIAQGLENYFNRILKTFKSDKIEKNNFLHYANFWGGLIKLLDEFIKEGLDDMDKVHDEIKSIKQNLRKFKGLEEKYDGPLLISDEKINIDPSRSRTQNLEFLKKYRNNSNSSLKKDKDN
jgi:DGQHR domain-containing protein